MEYVIDDNGEVKLVSYKKYKNKFNTYEERIEYLSNTLKGENNPNFGNRWSNEQRKSLSEKKKGISTITDEGRKKISEVNKGVKGKFDLINKTRVKCDKCGFETTLAAFNRYHKICPLESIDDMASDLVW
jgi:hypothetical protein